jgi:hypothetical protein
MGRKGVFEGHSALFQAPILKDVETLLVRPQFRPMKSRLRSLSPRRPGLFFPAPSGSFWILPAFSTSGEIDRQGAGYSGSNWLLARKSGWMAQKNLDVMFVSR